MLSCRNPVVFVIVCNRTSCGRAVRWLRISASSYSALRSPAIVASVLPRISSSNVSQNSLTLFARSSVPLASVALSLCLPGAYTPYMWRRLPHSNATSLCCTIRPRITSADGSDGTSVSSPSVCGAFRSLLMTFVFHAMITPPRTWPPSAVIYPPVASESHPFLHR